MTYLLKKHLNINIKNISFPNKISVHDIFAGKKFNFDSKTLNGQRIFQKGHECREWGNIVS